MEGVFTALTAIAVYGRICEIQNPGLAAVIGIAVGVLAQYAYRVIKKSA